MNHASLSFRAGINILFVKFFGTGYTVREFSLRRQQVSIRTSDNQIITARQELRVNRPSSTDADCGHTPERCRTMITIAAEQWWKWY
jgi:hypothetical protein